MKIYFKNGTSIEIIKEIGDALNGKIIQGYVHFQTFRDQDGKLLLILNLDEVVYVQ
jgi:hypothetical protein